MQTKNQNNRKRGALRLIAAGVFGAAFLWFALPVPIYGVLNVGNAAGMLACAAGVAVSLRFPQFIAFLRRLWRRVPGKLAILAAACCLLLAVGTTIGLTAAMYAAASAAPQGEQTVLVLGCKVRGTEPSLMLSRRIAAAEAYLKANPAAVAILSGGQGDDEAISEAACMFQRLTDAGIAPERLYREDRSVSTAENLAYSARIMREQGLSDHIVIVTDGFHQFRAGRLAKKYVSSVAAVNAKTPVILLPTYTAREIAAILYHWLFGV